MYNTNGSSLVSSEIKCVEVQAPHARLLLAEAKDDADAPGRPLVMTWCSSRKRSSAEPIRLEGDFGTQSLAEAAWRQALAHATGLIPADSLYCGRAFLMARALASRIGADLRVVSTGLGWVAAETAVPAYDMTLARNALQRRILGRFDALAWWESVIEGPYSTSPGGDLRARPLVLACVSRSYAPLLADVLRSVPVDRLRVFGSGITGALPSAVRAAVMPYDERLQSLMPGMRSDFAQRAMTHFVDSFEGGRSLEEDRTSVSSAMGALRHVAPPVGRAHVGDDDLREVIRELSATTGLRKTGMLRHLRDSRKLACEQGRFSRLYAEVVGSP